MIEEFERHLRGTNLSENTISSYLFAIRQYSLQYDGITKKNLRAYKVWLIENYKPKTVNLRLRAINCYLESIGKESWKMPFVRVQQKAFLENVISEADYGSDMHKAEPLIQMPCINIVLHNGVELQYVKPELFGLRKAV